jgi:hypothetical protein
MMKEVDFCKINYESGVSHLIEYMIITGILILLMIIMTLSIVPVFVEGPLNNLNYYAYNDIGNGVSTRIVDLYSIVPEQNLEGYITRYSYYDVAVLSKFDIPDEIAGRGYFVEVVEGGTRNGSLIISGDSQTTQISLSGIGETIGVIGKTSSSGLNQISYNY